MKRLTRSLLVLVLALTLSLSWFACSSSAANPELGTDGPGGAASGGAAGNATGGDTSGGAGVGTSGGAAGSDGKTPICDTGLEMSNAACGSCLTDSCCDEAAACEAEPTCHSCLKGSCQKPLAKPTHNTTFSKPALRPLARTLAKWTRSIALLQGTALPRAGHVWNRSASRNAMHARHPRIVPNCWRAWATVPSPTMPARPAARASIRRESICSATGWT